MHLCLPGVVVAVLGVSDHDLEHLAFDGIYGTFELFLGVLSESLCYLIDGCVLTKLSRPAHTDSLQKGLSKRTL